MVMQLEHRQVPAQGIRFHVAISGRGDGPSILCLHGFPEGWMSWRPVMEALGETRVYAPDLRGYGDTERTRDGYDIFTLTADIKALIEGLELDHPILVGHDWGGALAWIAAHRYGHLIRQLVVINCPHPKTLARAILHCEDLQTFRVPWLPFFQLPWLPEALMTSALGRRALRLSFTVREGERGTMNVALVDELVARFQRPDDMRGPLRYYREMVKTYLRRGARARLDAIYQMPITVPVTLVWGTKDGALSARVAMNSGLDAGCFVEWRPLPGVGHFVSLEAPDKLATELRRLLHPSQSLQG
jgi:pimeloyl-ACP methyl ester carboxylesterase